MSQFLHRLFACITLLLLAAPAPAGQFALHVEAGDVDRVNCPVTAELKVPAELTPDEIEAWRKPGAALSPGNIPVQIEPVNNAQGKTVAAKLHWVEPGIKAGQKKTYRLGAWAINGLPAGYSFVDTPTTRDLKLGQQLIWRHDVLQYDPKKHVETFKHFHQVYGFHDDGFITQGVGGKQFPHHRGLFMGWNKTSTDGAPGKSYDTWHCTNGVTVKHRCFDSERDLLGYVLCRSSSVANWTTGEDKTIVTENRQVTTWNVGAGVRVLDFAITLTSGGGEVTLDGDPQHAGFQFRAAPEVGDTKAKYIRPAGTQSKGGDVWADTAWVVCQFKIKDQPYAVAHFDHPGNPGTDTGRTVYSTRDYGRFGSFAKLSLKEGSPLLFNYRIIIVDNPKDSEQTVEQIQKMYDAWVKPVKVTIGAGA
jgi:hypothetical protein